jgi:hypothetical protein
MAAAAIVFMLQKASYEKPNIDKLGPLAARERAGRFGVGQDSEPVEVSKNLGNRRDSDNDRSGIGRCPFKLLGRVGISRKN